VPFVSFVVKLELLPGQGDLTKNFKLVEYQIEYLKKNK
jgi:hypothetical protein